MWWFILTFVVGLAVGRVKFVPAAFLRFARRMITPCLVILVLLLGIDLGQQHDLMRQLPQIGWQSILISLCVTLASGGVAWLSAPFFFPHHTRESQGKRKERTE